MSLSCVSCTFLNAAGATVCEMCGQGLVTPPEAEEKSAKSSINDTSRTGQKDIYAVDDSFISCPQCTFNNALAADVCGVCEYSFDNQNAIKAVIASSEKKLVSKKSESSTFSRDNHSNCEQDDSGSNSEVMQNGLVPLLERALLKQHQAQNQAQEHQFKKRRLQSEAIPSAPMCATFRLCTSLAPHITQQGVEEGVHWSCGYRNIQMMCYTVQRMQAFQGGDNTGLFGSGADVPDVAGLQCWIERAWRAGFDPMGCQQLGGVLLGTDEWIGATECAVLLRYLGLRAHIVDFHSPKKPSKKRAMTKTTAGATDAEGFGDVPTVAEKRQREVNEVSSLSSSTSAAALSSVLSLPLVRWVRDYFDYKHSFLHPPLPAAYFGSSGVDSVSSGIICGDNSINSGSSGSSSSSSSSSGSSSSSSSSNSSGNKVSVTAGYQLPPLYFQHQGHSRTIIGYEQTSSKFSLLLFDPSSSGRKLRVKLEQELAEPTGRRGGGWQCMVKRGAHTLTHGQYQIVYLAPGNKLLPGTAAYENGKELSSAVYQ